MAERDDELDMPAPPPNQQEPEQHQVVQALNEFNEAQEALGDDPAAPDAETLQTPPEIPAAPDVGPVDLPEAEQPATPTEDIASLPDHARNLVGAMEEFVGEPEKPAAETKPGWVEGLLDAAAAMLGGDDDRPPEDDDAAPEPVGGFPVDVKDDRAPAIGGHGRKAEQEAAAVDALRAALDADFKFSQTVAGMLKDHARRLDQLTEALERER